MSTTAPTHVEHAQTALPSLSQILDKESHHQSHATEHAILNDSIPNLNPESSADPVDIFVPPNTLLNILQSITALKHNTTKMETEIVSLRKDNASLRLYINDQLNSGLNKLANVLINKIDQSATRISNTQEKEFETAHKNNLVINDNIKNIVKGNQSITNDIDSLKEKLSSTLFSTSIENKLDNLEKTIEKLQLPIPATPCQGHSSLDAPSELNPPQRIPSPLFFALLVPQAEG